MEYTKNELLGKNFSNFFDKNIKQKIFQAYNKLYNGKEEIGLIQFQYIGNGDNQKILENLINLKRNSDEKVIGFYGIIRDITEIKKSEENSQISFSFG